MYKNIFVKKGYGYTDPTTVFVWDDVKGLQKYRWSDFNYCYKPDPNGTYTSLYGEKLRKLDKYNYTDPNLVESDLPKEMRVLTDLYLDSDEPSVNNKIVVIDLETSVEGGFPDIATANKEITAISLYDKTADVYYALLLDPNHRTSHYIPEDNVKFIPFTTETELLKGFMKLWKQIGPDIVSHWNGDKFDIPYLIRRMNNLFGEGAANHLSPIEEIYYNEHREKYFIAGVSSLDYLTMYKKFTYSQQPSYRLDQIGLHEVNLGKIEYDGSLDDLYNTDIQKFIEYNLRDVKIVKMIDDKMKLIELVRFICHAGHVAYEDFEYSSRFIDGTIVTYLHRKGIICPNKPDGGREEFNKRQTSDEDSARGAFVKPPYPGLYEYVFNLDLQSLYPSIIITLNISPESIVFKIADWDAAEFRRSPKESYTVTHASGKSVTVSAQKLNDILDSKPLSVASNGVVYDLEKTGVIPQVLIEWFAKRKEFKKLMIQYANEGNTELAEFYDRRQHVQKILLNSCFGVILLPIFRFFNKDNGEAVTITGQEVIKSTATKLSRELTSRGLPPKSASWMDKYEVILQEEIKEGRLTQKDAEWLRNPNDHCIYIDTDSVYLSAAEFFTTETNDEKVVKTISLANEMASIANTHYDTMASEIFNCTKHRLVIKGESVAKTGFWVRKKRYAMKKIYDLETNLPVDSKIAIKGLDIVRSTFPPSFKKLMKEILGFILDSKPQSFVDQHVLDFINILPTLNYLQVAKSTGVKDVTKWDTIRNPSLTEFVSRTPAHVKGSLIYNRLMKELGMDKLYSPIRNGDKIKLMYLKDNKYGIDSIAIKNYDDPPEFIKLVEECIDYDRMFESELEKKLQTFYSSLEWGKIPTKINQNALNLFDLVD